MLNLLHHIFWLFILGFKTNLDIKKKITNLSEEYWKYKGFYNFSTEYKGSLIIECIIWCLPIWKNEYFLLFVITQLDYFFSEYEFLKPLKYVKIRFNAPVFDKVTKDRAAKFVDKLSAIGGTMGLLTGFSIISGVEIAYFASKIAISYLNDFKKTSSKKKTMTLKV